jgi:hypothetical protein
VSMDRIVNVRMLSHPVNWGIVWTVLLFAGFAWSLFREATASDIPANPK